MSPDLETLRALADGELPPQQRAEVEAAVAADAELTAALHALLASRLPYQCAFAQQPDPPVPAALQARVAELSSVAAASHDMALAGDGHGGASSWTSGLTGVRAMVLASLLLAVGLVAGFGAASYRASGRAGAVEPWVMKVAAYHSMYGRETVSDGSSGAIQAAALRQRLHSQGLELSVPDLSSHGLQFVRAQQLQFDGRMVLQMVYLPRQGTPVALCLTPLDAQPERAVTIEGLQAVTWHAGHWAYVLVGDLPGAEMQAIRRELPGALI